MALRPVARLHADRFPQPPASARGSGEDVLAFVRQYHLDERDPYIRALAAAIMARPDQRAFAQLSERLRPFREFHREHPFVTAPPTVLTGPIVLGRQTADDRPIGLTTDDINLHGTIVGPSGAGKTTILLTIARALHNQGVLLGVIDVKEDFGWLLREPDILLIDEHTRWNFLRTPSFLTAAEHRNETIDQILARFFGRELQRQLLEEGWQRAARANPDFSMSDLADAIAAGGGKETPSHAEARRSCVARLRRFAHYALFTTRDDGIPWEVLLNRTFVVRSTGFDDLARLQFDLLSRYCFLNNRATRTSGLHRVLLIDESYELLSDAQDGIRSIETLPRLKQLAREFGIAVFTTTVTLRGISDLAQASTHIHVALPPNNAEDARSLIRTLGLTNEQADHFLHVLHRGEALLRIGSWPEVIHLQIPPNTERKHASDDDITNARARTNRHAPLRPLATPRSAMGSDTAAAREGIGSTGQLTPAHDPAPSSSPPARVAPAVEQTIPPNAEDKKLSLNDRERKILTYTAQRGVLLVTELLTELHLHAMQESRTRKNLRALGLIEEHRIITRAGRGGTSTALTATNKAHEHLRMPRAHLGKGGPAHRYYLRELRDHLGATLEVHETDAIIAYSNERHARLQHAFGIALNDGDTIAIEVEVSNPRMTAPRIAERTKGFTHTIIATLPQHVAGLRATHPDLRVMSVLDLLDQVRA